MSGLPMYELTTKSESDQNWVWDKIRKKWLVLTPEEHVRQCLVEYLTREKAVPAGLISQERGLNYDRRRKRYDLVVFNRLGKPTLACECKAPYVALDRNAALQLAVYNRELQASLLIWTNGQRLLVYRAEPGKSLQELPELPNFDLWSEGLV